MAFTDRELFARLIRCEAEGEGDAGMRGVASVVMNRVNASGGEYLRVGQGSLRRIIEQPGQFTCMASSVRSVWSNPPEGIHYEIADWAMAGGTLNAVDNSLWFMNPFRPKCPGIFPYNGSGSVHNRINDHCYYVPTAKYAQT